MYVCCLGQSRISLCLSGMQSVLQDRSRTICNLQAWLAVAGLSEEPKALSGARAVAVHGGYAFVAGLAFFWREG